MIRAVVYLVTCLVVAFIPLVFSAEEYPPRTITYAFPESFRGEALQLEALPAAEQAFYEKFPGRIGYYAIANRPSEQVLFRFTEQSTRMLHSAEGCYRAGGAGITHTENVEVSVPELTDQPIRWSQFRVVERDRPFLVRQCILSLGSGQTYADIPAWYWQTTFGSADPGPWLAVSWKLPPGSDLGAR